MLHMIQKSRLAGIVVSAALCAATVSGASAEVLRTGGTGSAMEMLKHLGEAFAAVEPGVKIQVIPSLGSTGGINAVADGALDFSVSGRALKAEEAPRV